MKGQPHVTHAMRYPASTPTAFSGAQRFVEQRGIDVWSELCDTVMPDQFFNVSEVASRLDSLSGYQMPERYLRAVLKAVMADYADRPDDYEHHPPVRLRGRRMDYACV